METAGAAEEKKSAKGQRPWKKNKRRTRTMREEEEETIGKDGMN